MVQAEQNVPNFCEGVSIESRAKTLTKAVSTPSALAGHRAKVDFHEGKVPFYTNGRKSGLNRPWLERAACCKRQEVSGTLITRWNEASWALPVSTLKSNYLDCWLNDWVSKRECFKAFAATSCTILERVFDSTFFQLSGKPNASSLDEINQIPCRPFQPSNVPAFSWEYFPNVGKKTFQHEDTAKV